MPDQDLAKLYNVPTGNLKRAVQVYIQPDYASLLADVKSPSGNTPN